MALLLALDESSSWLGALPVGEEHDGTAEEQAFVADLKARGEWGDLERGSSGSDLDLGSLVHDDAGPATALDLAALSERLEADVEPARRIARLQHLDRVAGLVASLRNESLVDLAGEESSGALMTELHVEHEVAVARRTSRYSAGRSIENARALATVFPGFAAALRAGEVTEAHVSVLVERSRVVSDPEVLAEVGRRALPKARRMTPGELGKVLAAIIADVDPDAAARTRRARESRRVWTRPLDDGLSFLGLVHDTATIDAIKDAITADAVGVRQRAREADRAAQASGGEVEVDREWDDASLDSLRADALSTRVLGTVAEDGSVVWDRSEAQVVVEVVMTLDQVLAEVEQLEQQPSVALVDGAPAPAAIARELADAATWWRRLVTDPVDGHLLDYGTARYLPPRVRRFVLKRDGVCRAPGCTDHAASRMQMDHAEPFPAGTSSAQNCGALSIPCHQLKTEGYVDIVDSRSDGSATWVTAWGQRVTLPPRPVLPGRPDPEPPPSSAPPRPPSPPPTVDTDVPPF
ncbi:MAG: DUF222 domain-containing protein [Candidatus Nanopelagicales bacterium]